MKRISLLLLVAMYCLSVNAQLYEPPCMMPDMVEQLKLNDPDYENDLIQTRQQIEEYLQQNPQGNDRAVRTISVVVHVVYNTSAGNVSNTAINNMIQTLNEDFRRQNPDAANTRPQFVGVAADAQIEFCLDQVIRKSLNYSCYNGDGMKYSSQGGSNAVNPSQFLNIWIVDICGGQSSGVAGYAYLPTPGMHGSSLDGLVLDYQLALGSGDRVATHEIGHYFGLEHVWGSDSNPSCSTDDGFTDTPNTSGPNYGCFVNNSCNTPSPGDQVENYMDYSSCQNMFTAQQSNFMNAVLTQIRGSLLSSSGCSSNQQNISADFTANTTNILVGGSVNFTDQSTGNPTAWSWSFQGGSPSTSSAQNPTNITYNSAGTYTVTLTASKTGASDVETKVAYINVVTPSSGCDTLSNLGSGDTLQLYGGSGGYLAGHNAYGDLGKAEFFDSYPPGKQLTSVYIYFAVGKFANSNSKVTVKAWDNNGSGGSPGSVLVQQDLLISTIAANISNSQLTEVVFNNPPAINSNFFVGINFVNSAGDTVAIVTNTIGQSVPATGWEQWSDGTWHAYDDPDGWGIGLSHAIFPVLCAPGSNNDPPVVDFVASNTTVLVGNSINFTDLSTNAPTSWSWVFQGGSPTTSTQQHPQGITYNTVGTYNVSLTAGNTYGSNSATKTAYITVINPTSSSCDTLSNIDSGDTLSIYGLTQGGWGYVSGHNIYGDIAKADKFTGITSGDMVTGALFYFGAASYANGSSKVTAKVWDANGSGGAPGTELATEDMLISSIANQMNSNGFAEVTFSNPPTVTANFYLGVEFTYAAGDTIGLITTLDGNTPANVAWEKWSDGTWHPYSEAQPNGWELDIANAIFPIVCSPQQGSSPNAIFTSNTTNICPGQTVNFTDQSTNNPTSWSWSFPGGSPASSNQQNPTVTYVNAGTYSVILTVTNNSGTDTETTTNYVNVGNGPSGTLTKTDVNCNGGTSGTVTLSVSGGQSPYTYSWSNGATSQNLTGVAAGNYAVTITDANGCSSTKSTTVTQPSAITVSSSANDADCGQSNGSAAVTVSGGTSPYTYAWSNGQTGANLSNIGAGNYTVTVTDSKGCQKTATASVSNVGAPSVTLTASSVNCNGDNNGSINSSVSGGSSPYTYAWSNGQTTPGVNGLSAGTYALTVTDNAGCAAVVTKDVTQPAAITVATLVTPASSNTSADGSIDINVTGGTPIYNVLWSTGATTHMIGGLAPGTYSVIITDAAGCTHTESITVGSGTGVAEADGFNVSIFPNPNYGRFNILLSLRETEDIEVVVHNTVGQLVYQRSLKDARVETIELDLSGMAGGTYFVSLQTEQATYVSKVVKLD